jgi:hypothetical protein
MCGLGSDAAIFRGQYNPLFAKRSFAMKFMFAITSAVALSTTPALAADGLIPNRALQKLGLGEMKIMSDADGFRIRGMSSSVGGFTLSTASTKSESSGGAISYAASGSPVTVSVSLTTKAGHVSGSAGGSTLSR